MTLSTRTLTQTLAALAMAASIVSGVLYVATDAAYAVHVDHGTALLHGHRMVAHTTRSHTQRQFLTRVHCPACGRYHLKESLPQNPGLYGGKEVTSMKARRQDATAVEAAVLAKLSAILTPYRLGHIPIHHCDIVCLRH